MEGKAREVTLEELQAAMQRYPGLPAPLAVSRYMLDERMMNDLPLVELQAGTSWGSIHAEMVGRLLEWTVDKLQRDARRGATIRLTAADYPESHDHWDIEVTEVDAAAREEVEPPPEPEHSPEQMERDAEGEALAKESPLVSHVPSAGQAGGRHLFATEMTGGLAERFREALKRHAADEYTLVLKGWQVGIVHGLVALACDHPGIQKMSAATHDTAKSFREWCKGVWRDMGLTEDETELLDRLREDSHG